MAKIPEEDIARWAADREWHHIHPYAAYNVNTRMLAAALTRWAHRHGLLVEKTTHHVPGFLTSSYEASYIDFRFVR